MLLAGLVGRLLCQGYSGGVGIYIVQSSAGVKTITLCNGDRATVFKSVSRAAPGVMSRFLSRGAPGVLSRPLSRGAPRGRSLFRSAPLCTASYCWKHARGARWIVSRCQLTTTLTDSVLLRPDHCGDRCCHMIFFFESAYSEFGGDPAFNTSPFKQIYSQTASLNHATNMLSRESCFLAGVSCSTSPRV